jgi:anti-sigma regulatory factor (Ser/Thr protein kinase)
MDGLRPDPVEIDITSEPERIAEVRDASQVFAARVGFGQDQAAKIALATDEALANVIKHGYDGRAGLPIHVKLQCVQRDGRWGLCVTITDEAKRVDPALIRGRDLDDIRPGGLGVYLMRTIMDDVHYQVRDRGMALEMFKFLD